MCCPILIKKIEGKEEKKKYRFLLALKYSISRRFKKDECKRVVGKI